MPKLSGWFVLLLIVVGCTPQLRDTPIPTLTLIPPTITPTITPVLPTITPQELPDAQDFNLTPSPTPLRPLIDSDISIDTDVILLTRQHLADNTGVTTDRIQLIEVTPRIFYTPECSTGQQILPSPLSHGYEIVWMLDSQSHTYLTWHETEFVWCQIEQLRGDYLTAVDPIAAELSALAIRRVRQQEDVDPDAVALEDIFPAQWSDSSLGCPQDGQVYTQALIDGYRIVVGDGETSYLFHTDSVQLVPCDFENEAN